MTYVFGRTGGDAQKHLSPRYDEESEDPFSSDKEMINCLASVYEDRYKVQNARLDYRSLTMRTTETFAEFNTRFLHLAGQAKIPQEDLRPDLFDKLTLELQRTVLPVYSTLTTVKSLADECLALDQGLRRLKARSDRIKARTASTAQNPSETVRNSSGTARNTGPTNIKTESQEPNPAPGRMYPERARPTYSDPNKQTLSNRGACFSCGKEGHMARDCPDKGKVLAEVDNLDESGKEEP